MSEKYCLSPITVTNIVMSNATSKGENRRIIRWEDMYPEAHLSLGFSKGPHRSKVDPISTLLYLSCKTTVHLWKQNLFSSVFHCRIEKG